MVLNINWDLVPLGLEPDHVIAKRLGCRPVLVGDNRRKRGIAAPCKEPQTFKPGPIATDKQMAQYNEQWRRFPQEVVILCRQCEEDFYLNRAGSLQRIKENVRRDTDQGVYCLKHYAALPLCGCCEREFTYREGGLCESCCRELDKYFAGLIVQLTEYGEE